MAPTVEQPGGVLGAWSCVAGKLIIYCSQARTSKQTQVFFSGWCWIDAQAADNERQSGPGCSLSLIRRWVWRNLLMSPEWAQWVKWGEDTKSVCTCVCNCGYAALACDTYDAIETTYLSAEQDGTLFFSLLSCSNKQHFVWLVECKQQRDLYLPNIASRRLAAKATTLSACFTRLSFRLQRIIPVKGVKDFFSGGQDSCTKRWKTTKTVDEGSAETSAVKMVCKTPKQELKLWCHGLRRCTTCVISVIIVAFTSLSLLLSSSHAHSLLDICKTAKFLADWKVFWFDSVALPGWNLSWQCTIKTENDAC